jgi:NADH-quinone oxidoreductase subunit J
MLEILIFAFLGLTILTTGIMILVEKKPVYNAFYLIIALLSMAGIYGILGAPFIATLQILVYAGAGVVLIIMIIMFYDIEKNSFMSLKRWWTGAFLLIILIFDFVALKINIGFPDKLGQTVKTKELSMIFFKDFIYPFELISILILVGVLGIFIFAKRGKER